MNTADALAHRKSWTLRVTTLTSVIVRARPFSRLSKRFAAGITFLVVRSLSPALIPLVLRSGLPAAGKTARTGGLAFALPELAALVAVAVMGRDGFQDRKRLLRGLLRRVAPRDRVSRTRYHMGLVMFVLPLLLVWLGPHVQTVSPVSARHVFPVPVISDVVFVTSFFVLRGGFWDKVRSLFTWETLVHVNPIRG